MTDELWMRLPEFPNYEISDLGRIYNLPRQKFMATSKTTHGHLKISLVNRFGRHDRSVALMVAQMFVQPPDLLCDRVVIRNDDLEDVRAVNLMWRPAHFAWKYIRQLRTETLPGYYCNLEVMNMITKVKYKNIIDAGLEEGLLFEDIWRSTYTGNSVYPHHHRYEILKRV